tara:strand:+ start:1242 stop:1619 length:378 start_codon:yes stop_codon:yes gene_type:complete
LAHAEALRAEDSESQLAGKLGDDYRNAGLTPKQVAMLEFAELLTLDPANMKAEFVEVLREAGWTDEDIVDIVHITAFYSYMVRIADGLGVELDTGRGWEPLAERLSFREETSPKTFGKIAAPASG